MKLHEFQGKDLFKKYGIPVPAGQVALSAEEALSFARIIGRPCVLKAQIFQGGRGKAGGVAVAQSPQQAFKIGEELLKSRLKGEPVSKILIEEKVDFASEAYLAIAIDDVRGKPVAMASASGGVDIEEQPEKIASRYINPLLGLRGYEAVALGKRAGFSGKMLLEVAAVLQKMYRLFSDYDAELVEINPAFVDLNQKVIAGDSKIIINDDSLFRHGEFKLDEHQSAIMDPFELKAKELGFTFVNLGGNIAVISVGAGFTMTLLDMIHHFGGKPANFADMMGGSGAETMAKMADLVLTKINQDQEIKALLITITFTATSLDGIIRGLVASLQNHPPRVPVVSAIRASDAAVLEMDLPTAQEFLKKAGAAVFDEIADAIKAAVEYASERK